MVKLGESDDGAYRRQPDNLAEFYDCPAAEAADVPLPGDRRPDLVTD